MLSKYFAYVPRKLILENPFYVYTPCLHHPLVSWIRMIQAYVAHGCNMGHFHTCKTSYGKQPWSNFSSVRSNRWLEQLEEFLPLSPSLLESQFPFLI